MSYQYQDATLQVTDGVAQFTLNRPDKLNALTEGLKQDFSELVGFVARSSDVRALVITGAGRAFSAGGDVKSMQSDDKPPSEFRDRVLEMHAWLRPLHNLNCPVIAAVNGLAYGGGFALALAADFVLAADSARFCAVFGRIGLIPDMALLYTLPRVVGTQRAKELMFTARSIDAQEAKELGIVLSIHRDDSLQKEAIAFAHRLAQGSKEAMGLTKQLINRTTQSDYDTMADLEANGQAMMHETEFHKEAVRRFAAKEAGLFNWDEMDR
jgi:2-(1,2-epoxy-1,2-dihydrophenyl)acetyl-CoA isomerase